MKVAFFHDHRFRRDAAGVHFSNGGLPYAVLQRYLRHFDDLVVVGRVEQLRDEGRAERLTVASGEHVEMACVENLTRLGALLGTRARAHAREVLSRCDCAIVRMPSLLGIVASREAIRMRKPWMAEVVACPWDSLWNHGSRAGKASAPLLTVINRYLIGHAPFALYVTEKFLQRRYPCAGEAVGCSDVAIATVDQKVLEQRIARIRSGFRNRAARLGIVGSLDVGYKGHQTALRALALVAKTIPNVKLSCLGSGDASRWRALARELGIAEQVEFVGVLPSGGPVLEWMDALDIYAIPSQQEGLPRALVEAMSRALPAVGAATGGIPELLQPRYIHSPKDHRHLAELVQTLVSETQAMEASARANFQKAREYSAPVLEERRDRFLARFRAFAQDSHRDSAR